MVERYSHHPGSKGRDGTSQEAANAIAPIGRILRQIALEGLHALRDASVLEVVEYVGLPRESLQPRFSELRALGLIEATGERRRNPSGKRAAVLRLTDKGKAALASPADGLGKHPQRLRQGG